MFMARSFLIRANGCLYCHSFLDKWRNATMVHYLILRKYNQLLGNNRPFYEKNIYQIVLAKGL